MTYLELIEKRSAEFKAEIARMADEALKAVGVPASTVNRRRGQLNRYILKGPQA